MKHLLLVIGLVSFACSVVATTCKNCNKLTYIENKGQWEKQVRYKADLHYGALFLEDAGYTLSIMDSNTIDMVRRHQHRKFEYTPESPLMLKSHVINVSVAGASPLVKRSNRDTVEGYYNYFLGNDKARWASGVHGYQEVVYADIYPGIDWKVSSENAAIKTEWIVKANKGTAKELPIKLLYKGSESLAVENGALVIGTSLGKLMEHKPYCYQVVDGKKNVVQCSFVVSGNAVSFSLPQNYNPAYDLVIDPVLTFSTYSGSTADNFGYTATFDSKGFAFAAGSVFGNGYPTTTGAIQTTWAGGTGTVNIPGSDIGITKYSPDGTQRIYSTYLGGRSDELPHSLIVNSNDELFLFGTTSSNNFPVTAGAFDTSYNGGPDPLPFNGLGVHYRFGSDIIVSRISADGKTLQASTYIGGTGVDGLNISPALKFNYADEVRGEIDIDKQNNIYIATCTTSPDFPVTACAFQDTIGGGLDGVIIKMNNNLNTIVWSSYLGGEEDDAIYSLSIDQADDLYVCGGTFSELNFPVTANALQQAFAGGRSDGFVTLVDKSGSNIIYSTYWGKADYDQIYFVENGKKDNVYVVGQTIGGDPAYIYNAAYSNPNSGLFITNMTSDLDSLVWGTLVGSGRREPDISPTAFLVDYCNKVYLSGWGSRSVSPGLSTLNLPVTNDAFDKITDGNDFWLMVMEDDASALRYATFFGNQNQNSPDHVDGGTSRYDKRGILYQSACAGCGGSSTFPTFPNPGAVSNVNPSGQCNNAVFKFDFNQPIVLADFDLPPIPCSLPATVTFTNTSYVIGNAQYKWTFSDGFTTTDSNATRTFTTPGLYTIKLVAINTGSCNGSDSITKTIRILSNSTYSLPSLSVCPGQTKQIGLEPSSTGETYLWLPSNTLNELDVPNPFATPTSTTTYSLTIRKGNCVDTLRQTVVVIKDTIKIDPAPGICPGDTLRLRARNTLPGQQLTYQWLPAGQFISGTNTATPLLVPKTGAVYTVRATNSAGCLLQDSIRFSFSSNIADAAFDLPNLPCKLPVTATFINRSKVTAAGRYTWTFSDGFTTTDSNAVRTFTATGTYTIKLVVVDSASCNITDTVTKSIRILNNSSSTLPAITICQYQTTKIGVAPVAGESYLWSADSTLNRLDISDPVASPDSTTAYMLTIRKGNCVDTIRQTVIVFKDSIQLSGTPATCPGDTVQLEVKNFAPGQPLTYDWQPSSLIISGAGTAVVKARTLADTTISVRVTNTAYGCLYQDSIRIDIFSQLPSLQLTATPDTIRFGDTSQLNAFIPSEASLVWRQDTTLSDYSILDPLAYPLLTTTYYATASDTNNCSVISSVRVVVLRTPCSSTGIYLPNAFTPNGDGKNDVLYVRGNDLKKFKLEIYDRWGQLVFETTDKNKGWDGNYSGSALNGAVFGYYLTGDCTTGSSFQKKGNITVIK